MGFFRSQQETTSDKLLVCLDLGSQKIRALAAMLKPNGEKSIIGIENEDSDGIKRGIIINPTKVAAIVRKIISRLEKKTKQEIGKVYVSTGGMNLNVQRNSVYRLVDGNQSVSPDLIMDMESENQKLFNDTDDEVLLIESLGYKLDKEIEIKDPVGSVCNRIDGSYLIAAAKLPQIENLRKTLKSAGINELEIVPGAYSSAVGILSQHEMEVGGVVVNIGAGMTQVAVFNGGNLNHMATIPFAGNVISADLKTGWNIQFDQAEKLKCGYGSALPELENESHSVEISGVRNWGKKEIPLTTLAFVIEARLEEIFANVANQIEQSGCFDKLGTGIVLTGGSSAIKNLDAFTKKNTGLDTCMGHPVFNYGGREASRLNEPENSVLLGLLHEANEDCAVGEGFSVFSQPKKTEPKRKPAKKKDTSSGWSLFDNITTSPKDVEF